MYKIMVNVGQEKQELELDHPPDTCPCCRKGIHPSSLGYAATEERGREHWIVVFHRCPLHACASHFLAYYHLPFTIGLEQPIYHLRFCEPRSNPKKTFPKTITKLSASFVEIYNQALAAEGRGLDQVCGPGYRKALEFLIKDYLIHVKPDDEATIKKTFLGNCIENHVSDPKVKATAKIAASLGNDETHYERKWANKDVADLRRLIHLAVNWIDSEILTDQAKSEKPG